MYPPKLKKRTVIFTALMTGFFLIAILGAKESGAVIRTAKLTVSARVIPYLQYNLISQISEITVTEEDIQRGYIEVRSGSRLEVKTNNPAGYMLAFEGSLWPFIEVQVLGLANPVYLHSGNAIAYQPSVKGKVFMDLSYRFILSENTRPGPYSWPLSISVHPA
jgi:hypothetical protein